MVRLAAFFLLKSGLPKPALRAARGGCRMSSLVEERALGLILAALAAMRVVSSLTNVISSSNRRHEHRQSTGRKSCGKSDSVCFEQSEHQIFRKEAGIPDVPGG